MAFLILVIIVFAVAWDRRAYTPMITATATLNFGSTVGGASTDLTMTITGAVVGDVVILGVPNGSVPAGGTFFGWISATNTATIRFANNDPIVAYDPASGTFRATVIKTQ